MTVKRMDNIGIVVEDITRAAVNRDHPQWLGDSHALVNRDAFTSCSE